MKDEMRDDMKIENDGTRDLLYVWLGKPGTKAARTETITAGIHADFDREDKLVGLEILDAAETLGHRVQFEVELLPMFAAQ
jgi:uncharacterized protein YuzE